MASLRRTATRRGRTRETSAIHPPQGSYGGGRIVGERPKRTPQYVRKVDANAYETFMTGVKHKLADQRAGERRTGATGSAQDPAEPAARPVLLAATPLKV